ncbi:hypothetical protein TIFTF001_009689 [Ficus carica]|uniref:Uncharacterized protein n=1 Tax=Ficus carica TaxID=3494 RepID=A0AA88DHJ3_FICCA|nr:hypothetical protein TIFTF001_009689 [Ficus carica]
MDEGLVTKRSWLLPLTRIPLSCILSQTSSKTSTGPHSIPTSPLAFDSDPFDSGSSTADDAYCPRSPLKLGTTEAYLMSLSSWY